MDKTTMKEFKNQKYINVETYRKTGVAVQTPVWFVQDGDSILVRTLADSGKMKRVRNNNQVRVAVCNMSGGLLGEWHKARAEVVQDPELDQRVNKLLNEKYGLIKKLFELREKNKETNYGIMRIIPDGIKDN